jgi:hypothetical protein
MPFLETVTESGHHKKSLRGIICPLIISVDANVVGFNPERENLCVTVFS